MARCAAPDRPPAHSEALDLLPWRSSSAVRAWSAINLLMVPLILGDWHVHTGNRNRASWRVHSLLTNPTSARETVEAFVRHCVIHLAETDDFDVSRREAHPETCKAIDAAFDTTCNRVMLAAPAIDALIACGAISKAAAKLLRTTVETGTPSAPSVRRENLIALHPPRREDEEDLAECNVMMEESDDHQRRLRIKDLMEYRPHEKLASYMSSNDDLMSLLYKSPRGSAPGPCSLTSEGLYAVLIHDVDGALIESACNLIRALASGAAPKEAYDLITQCSLIGIDKPNGKGIRPIAVCPSIAKWLSRTLLKAFDNDIKALAPFNFGVACPAGREAATLAVALDMYRNPDRTTVAVDLRNAFNEPSRRWLIEATYRKIPELAPCIARLLVPKGLLALSQSCCDDVIDSEEKAEKAFVHSASGTRQGDPLSPLLFSLIMHLVIADIKAAAKLDDENESTLSIAYLDDWTIRGSYETVCKVLEVAPEILKKYGLRMNLVKTVILEPASRDGNVIKRVYPHDMVPTTEDGIMTLGTPIGSDEYIVKALQAEVALSRELAGTLHMYANSGRMTNRPRNAMTLLRSSFAQKHLHLARTVSPRLFSKAAADFDEIIADTMLACVDEGGESIAIPADRLRHARKLCFRAPSKSGMGIPSVESYANSAYTTALLHSLHLWKTLVDRGMQIGDLTSRLLSPNTVLSDAELRTLTGDGDVTDPLWPLSSSQWSSWSTLAGVRTSTTARNSVDAIPIASDNTSPDTDVELPTSTDFVHLLAPQTLRNALLRRIPRSLQHTLTSLAMEKRDADYDTAFVEAATESFHRPKEHWASADVIPTHLAWLIHQECGGDGHEWVLDTGIRKDRFGNARRGNLLTHHDAPLAGTLWTTAVRTRLMLPLNEVFRTAQRAAGVHGMTRPRCGCPHCKEYLNEYSRRKSTPLLLDYYGLHLGSIATTYTKRHHSFNHKVMSFATKAGWTVHPENYSFRTSPSLSKADKDKHVDTRITGLSRELVNHIDPDALKDYAPSLVPPTLLTDYTFHHPGPQLKLLKKDDLREASTRMGEIQAESKVNKYRGLAAKVSQQRPDQPQLAFIPVVLSVYGRQHPITRRFLRAIARAYVTRTAGAVNPSPYGDPYDDGVGDTDKFLPLSPDSTHSLHNICTYRMHHIMTTLSTLVISKLVSSMFESAVEAVDCHPSCSRQISPTHMSPVSVPSLSPVVPASSPCPPVNSDRPSSRSISNQED